MILLEENDNLILLDDVSDEEAFIEINSKAIRVDNLPYSISGIYKWNPDYPGDPDYIETDIDADIAELKKQKLEEVYDKFNDLMENGTFTSSLGFEVDNRRGNGKDDKDNVNSLIDLGQEPIYFRDSPGDFHSLDLADLQTLKQEMIQDGLSKYQWKWEKETEIMSCTTLDELLNIII